MEKVTNCSINIKNIKVLTSKLIISSHEYGFSLIELVVAIAIIAILTSMVAVAYPSYTAKSQITTTILLLESYVKKAENYYIEHNTNNNGFANINDLSTLGVVAGTTSTDLLTNIVLTAKTGSSITLSATFNNKAVSLLSNKSLNLTVAADSNGTFAVSCQASEINNDYLPAICKT